jgi:hypothetical protein
MEEIKLDREDSFDSIPTVEFMKDMIKQELNSIDNEISEFKARENAGEFAKEPLLIEDKTRFVLFPIKQPDVSSCK